MNRLCAASERTDPQGKYRRAALEPLERRCLLAVIVGGFADELVAGGISNPTAMEFAPDGRLFIAQQGGALRVIENGSLLPASFISLTVDSRGERGLLGVAFDPNYATNRFVYVYHTVPGSPAHNRITRFTAAADNPNVAIAGSGVPILDLENLSGATNHNGGAIHFGPDGKLYVAVGENADAANAQTLNNRLGKMLRLNADGTAPGDNPFFTDDGIAQPRDFIWALGLRNPFTFAFDPADGTMHINDVGAGSWEEINIGAAGANYGWPAVEGPEPTPNPDFADPLFAYPHDTPDPNDNDTTGNVIAGGAFYRRPAGAENPLPDAFDGDYFFADSGHGWIRWLDDNSANASLILNNTYGIVDLKVGPDGSLYYLQRGADAVRRLRYTITPPATPDLADASDSGVNNSDNITADAAPTFTGSAAAGATVRIYSDGAEVGSGVAAGSGAYSITTGALAEGVHAITATSTISGNISATSEALSVTIDTTAPQVLAADFPYDTSGNRLTFRFSEDVSASLSAADLSVQPVPTGPAIVPAAHQYDSATDTASFVFASNFADGDYDATLAPAGVSDLAGNSLAPAPPLAFFALAGDANRDRIVNVADLGILASNWQQSSRIFSQGDFNYDGIVNVGDLGILATNWQKSMPAPTAVAPAIALPALPRRPSAHLADSMLA